MVAQPVVEESEATGARALVEEANSYEAFSLDEVVAYLWSKYGFGVFEELGEETARSLLRKTVSQHIRITTKAHVLYTSVERGSSEPRLRMHLDLAGGAYWSSVWMVGGNERQTRDLTPQDLDWLISDRRLRARRTLLQVKWLEAVRDLAKAHKAKTLRDLEVNGVNLPEIDEEPEE